MSTMASKITGVSIVYSTVCSRADLRKYQSSAALAFVSGIHRGLMNSHHKGPVTWKTFPFDDPIMLSFSTNFFACNVTEGNLVFFTNVPSLFSNNKCRLLLRLIIRNGWCEIYQYFVCVFENWNSRVKDMWISTAVQQRTALSPNNMALANTHHGIYGWRWSVLVGFISCIVPCIQSLHILCDT